MLQTDAIIILEILLNEYGNYDIITALQQVPQLVLGKRFAAGGKREGRKGREEKKRKR